MGVCPKHITVEISTDLVENSSMNQIKTKNNNKNQTNKQKQNKTRTNYKTKPENRKQNKNTTHHIISNIEGRKLFVQNNYSRVK